MGKSRLKLVPLAGDKPARAKPSAAVEAVAPVQQPVPPEPVAPEPVAVAAPEPAKPESTAARVKRLQEEARALAREHVESLLTALRDMRALTDDIGAGGDAYPVGARELSKRLAEELDQRAQMIQAVLDKGRGPGGRDFGATV